MKNFSTRQAAKKLGLTHGTLNNYIAAGKVPTPKSVTTGTTVVHIWSEEEIEHVRKLLPKIANGRKTRYHKKQLPLGNEQLTKTKAKSKIKKKPQPRAAHHGGSSTVPHEQRPNKH